MEPSPRFQNQNSICLKPFGHPESNHFLHPTLLVAREHSNNSLPAPINPAWLSTHRPTRKANPRKNFFERKEKTRTAENKQKLRKASTFKRKPHLRPLGTALPTQVKAQGKAGRTSGVTKLNVHPTLSVKLPKSSGSQQPARRTAGLLFTVT